MKNYIKNKITIWPHYPIYIIFVWGIGGAFGLLNIACPILLIFDNEPFALFDVLPLNLIWQKLIVFIPIAILYWYLFIRVVNYRIIFTDILLLTTKAPEAQDKKFEIQCKDVTDYKYTAAGAKDNVSIFFYLELLCYDGKKYKLFITSFTEKQIKKILKMVQERGGLKDHQDFENFKNH